MNSVALELDEAGKCGPIALLFLPPFCSPVYRRLCYNLSRNQGNSPQLRTRRPLARISASQEPPARLRRTLRGTFRMMLPAPEARR